MERRSNEISPIQVLKPLKCSEPFLWYRILARKYLWPDNFEVCKRWSHSRLIQIFKNLKKKSKSTFVWGSPVGFGFSTCLTREIFNTAFDFFSLYQPNMGMTEFLQLSLSALLTNTGSHKGQFALMKIKLTKFLKRICSLHFVYSMRQ